MLLIRHSTRVENDIRTYYMSSIKLYNSLYFSHIHNEKPGNLLVTNQVVTNQVVSFEEISVYLH